MRLLGLILFSTLIVAEDSWMIYDDSSVARVDIYVDSLALEWMYDNDNVESDSLHMAYIYYQNEYINDTLEHVGFRLRGNTSRSSQKNHSNLILITLYQAVIFMAWKK